MTLPQDLIKSILLETDAHCMCFYRSVCKFILCWINKERCLANSCLCTTTHKFSPARFLLDLTKEHAINLKLICGAQYESTTKYADYDHMITQCILQNNEVGLKFVTKIYANPLIYNQYKKLASDLRHVNLLKWLT